MGVKRPTHWWFVCEACLKPFTDSVVYCPRCLREVPLCSECVSWHDYREHHDTAPTEIVEGDTSKNTVDSFDPDED